MTDDLKIPDGTGEGEGDKGGAPDEPLWKTKGYGSEADMFAALSADKAEAELREKLLNEEMEKLRKDPEPAGPMTEEEFDTLYRDDPRKAMAELQKRSQPKPDRNQKLDLIKKDVEIKAAVEAAKTLAEAEGYDPDAVWALMHSISSKPEHMALRDSRDGVKKLAAMAKERLGKKVAPTKHGDPPGKSTPPARAPGAAPAAKPSENRVVEVAELNLKAKSTSPTSVISACFDRHIEKLKSAKKG